MSTQHLKLFTYDVYYRPLRNRGYKNGKFIDAVHSILRSPAYSKDAISKSNQISMTANKTRSSSLCDSQTSRMVQCYDVYWVTDTSAEFLYSYCCEEGGGGTPGGGGSNDPPVPIDSFTGFPTNPYEGQTATTIDSYGNHTEFTYSASLGGWLMLELEVLRYTGASLTIPNKLTFAPGSVLTSIALVVVVEPTFVGEIVLGGKEFL